uniref:hypothetical protein n=1 Tax=Aminipila sp. TaxID=2060095 RepID=UPI002F4260EA
YNYNLFLTFCVQPYVDIIETGISNLEEKIEEFKKCPTPEGVTVIGRKRTSIKLFIPNLTFKEEIEMGENVWVYMGENYESYCLY